MLLREPTRAGGLLLCSLKEGRLDIVRPAPKANRVWLRTIADTIIAGFIKYIVGWVLCALNGKQVKQKDLKQKQLRHKQLE